MPQLIARFLPYSVLLATIITLATFNQNSEVVAMKAAGLSAHQILAPLMLAALVVAGLSFAFNERVVTRANATLKAWEAVDYGPVPADPGVRANVYLQRRQRRAAGRADRAAPGRDTVMHGVTFYERDDAGMIVRQLRAPVARYADPGWRLEHAAAVRGRPAPKRATSPAPAVVARGLTPEQIALSGSIADAEAIGQLSRLDRRARRRRPPHRRAQGQVVAQDLRARCRRC